EEEMNSNQSTRLVSVSPMTAMLEYEMELAAKEWTDAWLEQVEEEFDILNAQEDAMREAADKRELAEAILAKEPADKPEPAPLTTKRQVMALLEKQSVLRVNATRFEGRAMVSAAEFVARLMYRDNESGPTLDMLERVIHEHLREAYRLNLDIPSEAEARAEADKKLAEIQRKFKPLKSQDAILGYLAARLLPKGDEKPSEPTAKKRPPKKGKAERKAKLTAPTPPMESMIVPAEPPPQLTEEEEFEKLLAEEAAKRAAEEREIEALIAADEAAKTVAEQAAEAAKAEAKAARGKAKAEERKAAKTAAKAQQRAA
ncbi:MAG: hypothetical protein AAB386_00835, partial [Patescibacteria group bacterium]